MGNHELRCTVMYTILLWELLPDLRKMDEDKIQRVNSCVLSAAEQASAVALSVTAVERFLRTSEETWEGAGSGRFTVAQFNQDGIYTDAVKTGMTILFDLLGELL